MGRTAGPTAMRSRGLIRQRSRDQRKSSKKSTLVCKMEMKGRGHRINSLARNLKIGVLSLVCIALLGLFIFSARDTGSGHQTITKLDAQVVGSDYRFGFRYPGEDLVLGTKDDRFGTRDFCVPAGAEIRLALTSRDYIYLVEIPKVNVYEVAAPDLDFQVTFSAPASGKYPLLGSQMCGYEHSELLGSLVVLPSEEFRRTVLNLPRTPVSTGSAK